MATDVLSKFAVFPQVCRGGAGRNLYSNFFFMRHRLAKTCLRWEVPVLRVAFDGGFVVGGVAFEAACWYKWPGEYSHFASSYLLAMTEARDCFVVPPRNDASPKQSVGARESVLRSAL